MTSQEARSIALNLEHTIEFSASESAKMDERDRAENDRRIRESRRFHAMADDLERMEALGQAMYATLRNANVDFSELRAVELLPKSGGRLVLSKQVDGTWKMTTGWSYSSNA